MIIIVCGKNGKAFKINIDPKKKVIELKEEIARHFKLQQTDFNILNKNEIIDNSKNFETIESCNIGRLIRLPVNYNPGYLYNYLFNI
jgi:hypothetical protein